MADKNKSNSSAEQKSDKLSSTEIMENPADSAIQAAPDSEMISQTENAMTPAPKAKKPAKSPLKKPKKKRFYQKPLFYILMVAGLALVVFAATIIINMQAAMQAASSPLNNTVTVERRSLVSDILTSGTVKSSEVEKVYAPSSLKVKEILKDVGDTVRAGEPLASLDIFQLELDIQQIELNISNLENGLTSEEVSLSTSARSASNSVETAKIQKEQAQRDYEKLLSEDGGSTVRNAAIALEDARRAYDNAANPASTQYSAQLDYDNARYTYDKAVRDRNDAYNAMQTAQNSLDSANSALSAARAQGADTTELQKSVTSAQTAYDSAQKTYNTLDASMPGAQIALEKARVAFDNSQKNINDTLLAKQDALEKAQMTYDDAVRNASESLRLAEEKLKNAELSYKNASDSLKVARSKDSVSTHTSIDTQRLNLASKQKQLDEAALLSPLSGVVTYANLSEGATANGLLYVIEDVESLMITATVGEYDIDSVKLGQKVIIKTDFTGSDEFIGEVTFISPTAQKGTGGETVSTNSVKFDIEITVTQYDPRLKVGMNATASIVTNEKEGALSVPFDAVYDRDNGEKYVVVLDENNALIQITVQIGIETDAFTEIISSELREGMRVVLNIDETSAMMPGVQFGVGGGMQQ